MARNAVHDPARLRASARTYRCATRTDAAMAVLTIHHWDDELDAGSWSCAVWRAKRS